MVTGVHDKDLACRAILGLKHLFAECGAAPSAMELQWDKGISDSIIKRICNVVTLCYAAPSKYNDCPYQPIISRHPPVDHVCRSHAATFAAPIGNKIAGVDKPGDGDVGSAIMLQRTPGIRWRSSIAA